MKIVDSISEFRSARAGTGTVGFVPTMGALHDGHAALIRRSVAECDRTVVSVFVNAAQFDKPDDLANYPRKLEEDAAIARSIGADILFVPRYDEMYPDGFRYRITETELSRDLCGAHRDGHFTGVLTVVMKLLNIVQPDRAYFGEKDYQQYLLISGMVDAFFMPVEIVPCQTVRESDGLALSSRNLNLDEDGRKLAPMMHKAISSDANDEEVARRLTNAGFNVDYVVTKDGRRFAAARVGEGEREVRLIDNVPAPEKCA